MPDRLPFPNRVRWTVASCIGWLAVVASTSAASSVPYWGQVQSHLEEIAGTPLIAANWLGRYRPYVLVGEAYVPLLQGDLSAVADVDLMSPLPLSTTEVLLLGTASGRPAWDLYLYDRGRAVLTSLTATPAVDEGNPCLAPAGRLLAYRTADGERVARIEDGLVPLRAPGSLPVFDRCTWADATTLLGVERRGRSHRLHRCVVAGDVVRCDARPALDDVETVTALEPAAPSAGVIGRRRGEPFRRPWALPPPFDALVAVPLDLPVAGDVLQIARGAVRTGFHGRYVSSLAPDSAATVYVTRRIGGTPFGIVATDRMTRTLARLEDGAWKPRPGPGVVMPATVAAATEVWMRSPPGEIYQAFYFGPPAPERVVVWWHGGPAESISPRFNPYFHRLNELGLGVLAVNYPGSTGRGAQYEARFQPAALADCVRAVWTYLRENGVREITSWSVSSGITAQAAVLAAGVPVSAIVDQSAWGRSSVRQDAARRAIPVFTIRGRYDPSGPTDHVDLWYPGGHDVTMAEDFVALFEAIAPFLAGLGPVTWNDDADPPALVLDAGAAPADAAIAFELATHLLQTCFPDRAVVVTPAGVPALGSAETERRAAARWRDRHPGTPVARLVLRGTVTPREPPGEIRPIDLADAAEVDRLRAHAVAADGSIVHPRLQSAAAAACTRLRAAFVEPPAAGTSPSPAAPRR